MAKTEIKGLTDVEVIAVTKAIKEAAAKTARNALTVPANSESQTHTVDMLVHVRGSVTVGADETYTPTTSIPLLSTLAFFIRRMGITRDAAMDALMEAMREALTTETGNADEAILSKLSEDQEIIAECQKKVLSAIAKLPDKTRSGKVTTELSVTRLKSQELKVTQLVEG